MWSINKVNLSISAVKIVVSGLYGYVQFGFAMSHVRFAELIDTRDDAVMASFSLGGNTTSVSSLGEEEICGASIH